MPPEQMQPPQDAPQNLPQEADQDQMIVQFLQELDNRVTSLEEKVNKDTEKDKTETPKA